MKEWKETDIEQCPRCGNDLIIYTDAPDNEAYDGDRVKCVECDFTSCMTVDSGVAFVQDNG